MGEDGDLVAGVEGLVVLHQLACMASGIQHHAAADAGAVRAHHMRAAILVLHPLHLGHLERHPCSHMQCGGGILLMQTAVALEKS